MNPAILHTHIQYFINQNLRSDLSKLLFKGSPFQGITIQELAGQIESKRKSKNKLPTWYASKQIYYPHKLNIEQTSSEVTARYKAGLISGKTLIDLTGGFGVDSYAFAKQFQKVIHCELNTELSTIVQHNFKVLKATTIKCIAQDGIAYLQQTEQRYDWVYIDPSRRSSSKQRVFLLKDCLPDIPQNLDILFRFSNQIMVKASPLLDISRAIDELTSVKEVHVVAVQNEVKELLFILKKQYLGNITIKTVNILKDTKQRFEATFKHESKARFSLPKTYLYEPNAAILKAGLFNEVSHQLNIYKLHLNSHLYTLDNCIDFPGRRFNILQVLPYKFKQFKKIFRNPKANITVRNFPETVAQIRKKTNLKEGGDTYLFFTTDMNGERIILICEKC